MLSVQQGGIYRVLVKFPFLYWGGPVRVAYARTLGDNGSGHAGGCLLLWLSRDALDDQQQTHVQQLLKLTHPRSCQAMIQCPACLPDVCPWTLAIRDAVHHPFPLLLWDRVSRMDQLLHESSKRPKGDLNGQGAQNSAKWLWQAMDVRVCTCIYTLYISRLLRFSLYLTWL